ncbi:MAG: phosphate permease [Nitrospiraceae bacterium]|nr:phosphate permease [Nitrospiraceae bacterium]
MDIDIIILSLATLVGFYMAANIGANDLANAMGTSVGSRALTIKQAVLISIIANILGAGLAGSYVTNTISKGIIDPSFLANAPDKLMIGMFAALIAAGLWVHLSTYLGLPVSTTHAIVGAVVGFGIVAVKASAISWGKVIGIATGWVLSPIAGALIAGGIYYLLEKKVMAAGDPYAAAVHYAPTIIFSVMLVLILSFIFAGFRNFHLHIGAFYIVLLSISCAALLAILGRKWVGWQVHLKCEVGTNVQNFSPIEYLFAQLQVLAACYIAFAHGANDVANAIGPLAAIFSVVKTKSVTLQVEVPFWMLILGGIAVGGGLFAFGARVIETVGKNITEITPLRGFCAQFGAATTILVCSRLGLPVSTTHVLVGSVVGVGLMRGMGALDLRILKNIGFSWIVTLPSTMVLAMILYELFSLFLS